MKKIIFYRLEAFLLGQQSVLLILGVGVIWPRPVTCKEAWWCNKLVIGGLRWQGKCGRCDSWVWEYRGTGSVERDYSENLFCMSYAHLGEYQASRMLGLSVLVYPSYFELNRTVNFVFVHFTCVWSGCVLCYLLWILFVHNNFIVFG